MQKGTPFKRAFLMMQAIAAMASLEPAARAIALGAMPQYESRGHGRNKRTGRKPMNQQSSKFIGVRNGSQECARRRRQIERGMLTMSNGLIPSNIAA